MKKNLCKQILLIGLLWVGGYLKAQGTASASQNSFESKKNSESAGYCVELEQLIETIQNSAQSIKHTQQFLRLLSQCDASISKQGALYSSILNQLTHSSTNKKNNQQIDKQSVSNKLEIWRAVFLIAQFIAQKTPQPSLNQLEKAIEKYSMKTLLIQTTDTQPFFVHHLTPPYRQQYINPVIQNNISIEFSDQEFKNTAYIFLIEKNQSLCQSTEYYQSVLLPVFNFFKDQVEVYLNQQEFELLELLHFIYSLQEMQLSDRVETLRLNHWSQIKAPFLQELITNMHKHSNQIDQKSTQDDLLQLQKTRDSLQLLLLWINIYNGLNNSILTHCIVDPVYTHRLWIKNYHIIEPINIEMDLNTKNKTLMVMELYKDSINKRKKKDITHLTLDNENNVITFYQHHLVDEK